MRNFEYRFGGSKQYIINFFSKGHPRTLKAKRNIFVSFILKGINIAISFLLVRITIGYVSPTQYGIWLTLSSIIAWFSFFDIGFGHGLRNKFAEAKATGDFNKAKIYISTTYAILSILFLLIWLVFFAVNSFLNWSSILNTSTNLSEQLSKIAIIIASFFCLQIVLKTVNIIVIADQKPSKASFFDMLGQLLTLLAVLILTKFTKGSLIYLGLALGGAPIFILILSTIFFFNGEYKIYMPSVTKIKFKYAREILELGAKFFLIQIAAVIIFQTTNIVIAQILGPQEVTIYNIAYRYFFAINMIFMIIITPFWSAFTEAYTKHEFSWMSNTVKKLNKIWLLCIPAVIIMILLSNSAYKIWIGNKISIPFNISVAMAVYAILFTRFNLFIYLINGTGKIKVQLYVNVILCLVYIPLSVILCRWKGIEGIIWGNTVVAMIHAIISQVQVKKLINNDAQGIWFK